MDNASFSDRQLITLSQYARAQARMLPRLPKILQTIKHIKRIGAENRESWGLLLEENAAKFPSNVAVKSDEAVLTYREYNEAVNRCANYLLSQGLRKGDIVALFLENRPALVIVYSAIAKIGAINCMINTNLRSDSLRHCLTVNPAKAFMVGEEVIGAFLEIKSSLKLDASQKLYFVEDRRTKPLHTALSTWRTP